MSKYTIDPPHSMAEFTVRHMMISTVRGVFNDMSGTLVIDKENPENSSVEATIKTRSVNTRDPERDAHLRSADFFDIENFTDMTFKSTKVEVTGDNTGKITGNLTIKDITKPVTFEVEYFGEIPSPFGDTRVGFNGTASVNREEFELMWNISMEAAGGVLVSKDVRINVELQAIKVTEEEKAEESAKV